MEFKTEEEYLSFVNKTVTDLRKNSHGTDFVLIALNDKFNYISTGSILTKKENLIPITWELIHFLAEKLKMKPQDVLGKFLTMASEEEESENSGMREEN